MSQWFKIYFRKLHEIEYKEIRTLIYICMVIAVVQVVYDLLPLNYVTLETPVKTEASMSKALNVPADEFWLGYDEKTLFYDTEIPYPHQESHFESTFAGKYTLKMHIFEVEGLKKAKIVYRFHKWLVKNKEPYILLFYPDYAEHTTTLYVPKGKYKRTYFNIRAELQSAPTK